MESSRSKAELLDAAARELLHSGYAASSLASIAARLGLTKGALGRKFPAKKDIAWGIIDTLREVIAEESSRALELYPHSGIRAMIRFLLAVGVRAAQEPQIAAGAVLITDRASPAFEVAEVLDGWVLALRRFLEVALDSEELPAGTDLEELSEYIFVTNLGEAIFGARAYAPPRSTPRLRFMRVTLRYAGVADADDLIDEVWGGFSADALEGLPTRSTLRRHSQP
ncbi:TetR/AcrR family transcriptional regulator [Microbacterium sp. W4I4]|uniref:TetR/AcrR family transcriptional regulator n=1 Tax=Microbacterium sp. W4I4 TaxID=3042295 RepID=UPI0027D89424|nr:TetR/AcrR family transcriptional regulator [Microbacterium sp. W4I4]